MGVFCEKWWEVGGGYIRKVKRLWDGKGITAREIPSLISQLSTIKYGGLTIIAREWIEEQVRQEQGLFGDSLDEEDFYGFEEDGIGETEQGREEDVDFAIEVDQGGTGGIREDVGQVEARIDMVWENGREVRMVSDVERGVLRRMREVLASEKTVDLPNLKAQDRRKVMAEVKMVDGLLNNLVTDGMEATEVNRLLYVGAFVVAERLDLLGKGKKKEREAMVATEIGEEYWRLEEGFGPG